MSGIRGLLSDAVIYGSGRYVTSAISVFFVPIYARILGAEGYGLIDAISVWSGFALTISVCGLDSSIGYYYFSEGEDRRRRTLLFNGLIFRIISSVMISILAFPVIQSFISSTGYHGAWYAILLSLLKNPIMTAGNYARDVLRLERRAWAFFWATILYSLLSIGVSIWLVVVLNRGLNGVFEAALIVESIALLPAGWMIRDRVLFQFDWQQMRDLVKYGASILPTTLVLTAVATLDRLAIAWILGMHSVGIYGMGAKIVSILGMALSGYQLAWGVWGLSIKDDPSACKIYSRVMSVYIFAFVFLGTALTLFGFEALNLLATREFFEAVSVIGLLCLCQVIQGAMNQLSIGSAIKNAPLDISIAAFCGGIVTVIAYMPLISALAIQGAAISTLLGYVVSCLVAWKLASRRLKVHYVKTHIILPLTFLLGIAVVAPLFPQSILIGVILGKLVILAILACVLGFVASRQLTLLKGSRSN